MITSFEEQTHPLTEYEREVLLPIMVLGFKTKVGIERCITNPQICKALKSKGYDVTEPRIRKIVFYIRNNNLVPKLIASSKGYWIATKKEEVEIWVMSLQSRLEAMQETYIYAQKILSDFEKDN
jgi:hypothetical protein